MHRTEATGDFTPDEARTIARLSRPIAEALKASYRVDAARRPDDPRAPGLLILDATDDIELTTPPAAALLGPLVHDDPAHREVPAPVLTLADDVRRRGRQGRTAPPLHVPTSSGWLTLHGSLPDGSTNGRVAIIVQPAGEDYALPLRLEVFGLTPREREIATLVARGLDTAAIAERLVISPWTVQDHLKAVFAKTDTRSRRELLARSSSTTNYPASSPTTPPMPAVTSSPPTRSRPTRSQMRRPSRGCARPPRTSPAGSPGQAHGCAGSPRRWPGDPASVRLVHRPARPQLQAPRAE